MVLFHAVSLYQVLNLLVYRMKRVEKENSILLIASTVLEKMPKHQYLNNFFEHVAVYDFRQSDRYADNSEMLAQYFDSFFRSDHLNLPDMEEIYLACAHHAFGIYVAQKGLNFNFVEDGSGALSRPWVLEETENKSRLKYQYAKDNGLYDGTNPHIIKRIYNPTNQLQGFVKDEDVAFDVVEQLQSMKNEERQEVCSIFLQQKKIDVPENSVLILTEHFANLNLMTWEEQEEIYQLLVDYFVSEKNLVFKAHPDDLMYYSLLFPESTSIQERFPAELLPFVFNRKVNTALTISSSSIYGIRKCFEQCIEFSHNFSYKKGFHAIHKYFAALCIAESAWKEKKNIYTYLLDSTVVENFIKFGGINLPIPMQIEDLKEVKQNSVVLINLLEENENTGKLIGEWLDKLPENVFVIFLNSKEDFAFYDYNYQYLWKWIFPAEISKKKIGKAEDFTENLDLEYVYVFCKEGLKRMDTIEKTLKNIGLTIDVNCFDDRENRIRALAGILQATEKRLLFYINKYEHQANDCQH